MKNKIILGIVCSFIIASCKNKNTDKIFVKQSPKPLNGIDFQSDKIAGDSIKFIVYNSKDYMDIDTSAIENSYGVFYFTFDTISEKKLEEISLLQGEEFDEKRGEYNISTIFFEANETERSFYLHFPENKTYHLTGLIQNNFLLKPPNPEENESDVRRIGKIIKEKIVLDN